MTTSWEEMAHLVTELAVQTSDGDNHDGLPLLIQLRRAVWGTTGRTMEGAGGNGLPLNQGAHIAWCELVDEIEGAFSQTTGTRGSSSTVVNLLAWWATFGMLIGQGYIDDLMQQTALDNLRRWTQRIRDQFDAPLSIPLRDFSCPNCGEHRAVWWDRDLEIEGPAIVVTLEDSELVASCRNPKCKDPADGDRSRWYGDPEVLFMARRAGIDVDALADEIREARMPRPELEYVEPDVRVVVPFDPTNPDHLELIKGGGAA